MKKTLWIILLLFLAACAGFLVLINAQDDYPYPSGQGMSANDRQIDREFRVQTLDLADTYDGRAVATLLNRPADSTTGRAVLYIHGYGDYFFQRHLADWYNDRGFDFYALDLRRYGRSWLPNQRPNYVEDLAEYFEEIDRAVELIRQTPGLKFLLLNGHSTGGLTASLYCNAGTRRGEVDALFLNSPFFDFNAPRSMELAITGMTWLGRWQPNGVVSGGGESAYTKALHKDYQGRWDFNTDWKPLRSFPVYLGWLRAIEQGHSRIEEGLNIECPVLVMHSDESYFGEGYDPAMHRADAVLDVREIHDRAPLLGDRVKIVAIPDAIHDIFLSEPPVLEDAYRELGGWLEETIPE